MSIILSQLMYFYYEKRSRKQVIGALFSGMGHGALIGKWITNKNTLEYIGIWEKINNPDFNYPEFGVINQEADINRFIMSVGQWITQNSSLTGLT